VSRRLRLAGVALVAGLASCGGGPKKGHAAYDLSQFECNDRQVEYMVAGGFVATEAGIRMECKGNKPRITRWRLEDSGKRSSSTFDLSGEQFDATWEKVDAAGWRFLDAQCDNPSSSDGDPVYSIDVGDATSSVQLMCTGKELPFPYDRLINELDLRAAGFGNDAGNAP
jgi:hypothetical protein